MATARRPVAGEARSEAAVGRVDSVRLPLEEDPAAKERIASMVEHRAFDGEWLSRFGEAHRVDLDTNAVLCEGLRGEFVVSPCGRACSLQYKDNSYCGSLSPGGSSIRWDDGDVWSRPNTRFMSTVGREEPGGFSGQWCSRFGNLHHIELSSDTVACEGLLANFVALPGGRSCSLTCLGKSYDGTLSPGGGIWWSDGDVWDRRNEEPDSVQDGGEQRPFEGRWWSKLGEAHRVEVDTKTVTCKENHGDFVVLPCRRLCGLMYKDKSYRGALSPGGSRIQWEDGDVWCRPGVQANPLPGDMACRAFSGRWCSRFGRLHCIEAIDEVVTSEGFRGEFLPCGNSCSLRYQGKTYHGILSPKGSRITWDDDDVWGRPGAETLCAPGLEVVSLLEALEIVGSLHDLRITRPAKLLEVFSSETPAEHPLRNLLRPEPTRCRTNSRSAVSSKDVSCSRFKPGDKVYAKIGPFKLNPWMHDEMALKGISDIPMREFYPATVQSYEVGTRTYTISWDHPDPVIKPNLRKVSEDLVFAGNRDVMSGAAHVLDKQGRLSFAGIAELSILAFLVVIALQLYACFLLNESCHDEESFSCEATRSLKQGHAITVGLASLTFSAASYQFIVPVCFRMMRRRNEIRAREIRKMWLAIVQDAIFVDMLPNITGLVEDVIVIEYFAILISFTVFTVIASDVGILAFGSLIAGKFMMAGNSLGKSSILQLRDKRFLTVAEELRKKLPLNMTREQLEIEVTRFLKHDARSDLMELSLEMATLLVAGSRFPVDRPPDSRRIRFFIIPRSYLSDYVDIPSRIPEKFEPKRDMIVDVCARTVTVPGIRIAADRFIVEGAKLPFFFALHPNRRKDIELQLSGLGLLAGNGAFTWRCAGGMSWLAHEASNSDKDFAVAQRVAVQQAAYGASMLALTRAGAVEKVQHLLAADADVNYHESGRVTALFLASQEGHVGLVQLLLDQQADPNITCESDSMSPLLMAAYWGHLETVRVLLRHRADVGHRGEGGHAPIDLAHSTAQHLSIARVLVEYRCDLHAVTRDTSEREEATAFQRLRKRCGDRAAGELQILAVAAAAAADDGGPPDDGGEEEAPVARLAVDTPKFGDGAGETPKFGERVLHFDIGCDNDCHGAIAEEAFGAGLDDVFSCRVELSEERNARLRDEAAALRHRVAGVGQQTEKLRALVRRMEADRADLRSRASRLAARLAALEAR